MSKSPNTSRVRATYEFIKAQRATYRVEALCRVLGVAPSGYYAWVKQPMSNRAQEDARLIRLIRASFVASQGIYGAPRVFLDLREAGEVCSKHRVARLMREDRLRALHGYRTRRWSVGKPAVSIPNLLQQFTVTRPNKAWVTDITYIRTWQGWLYLAVVMDLFSRKIVGWAARSTIHRELVLDAVLMAVRARRPRRALIHFDQGTQYGSDAWRRFCRSHRLEPSMSRKSNCWDNAVAEALFFSSLKKERIKKQIYKSRDLALVNVSDYIEAFHNRSRRHSHLGGISPERFEAAHKFPKKGCPLNPGNSKLFVSSELTRTPVGTLAGESARWVPRHPYWVARLRPRPIFEIGAPGGAGGVGSVPSRELRSGLRPPLVRA